MSSPMDRKRAQREAAEFHHVVTDTAQGRAGEDFTRKFVAAIAAHRHWDRPPTRC